MTMMMMSRKAIISSFSGFLARQLWFTSFATGLSEICILLIVKTIFVVSENCICHPWTMYFSDGPMLMMMMSRKAIISSFSGFSARQLWFTSLATRWFFESYFWFLQSVFVRLVMSISLMNDDEDGDDATGAIISSFSGFSARQLWFTSFATRL